VATDSTSDRRIQAALERPAGVQRRLEVRGEVTASPWWTIYGHHPRKSR